MDNATKREVKELKRITQEPEIICNDTPLKLTTEPKPLEVMIDNNLRLILIWFY